MQAEESAYGRRLLISLCFSYSSCLLHHRTRASANEPLAAKETSTMARNAAISVLRSLGAEATAPAMAAVGLTRSITGWHIFQKEKGQEWQGLPAVEKASYRLLAKGVDL